MARIRVSTVIDAPPREVWAQIEDVETHVRWMHDAETIRVTSAKSSGKGTRFECDTRVGPFRVTDHMEITDWRPSKCMAVSHEGLIKGKGRFTLRRLRGGRTSFVWTEKLRFPLWMGGPIGAFFGKFVLKRIWRENLRLLQAQIED